MTAHAGSDLVTELDGLRALARSLVGGDAEVDDLLQDTAVVALEHPPATDRPVRPWLATVLGNRWRMDRRGAGRRAAREQAAPVVGDVAGPDALLLVNLSGRGDKDMHTAAAWFGLIDPDHPELPAPPAAQVPV